MQKEYEINQIGLSNDKSPLQKEPALDVVSANISFHEIDGTGPRFGMSPVPGQSHTETSTTLRAAEGSTSTYSNRNRVYGLLTQKLEREGVSVPMPLWLCASERSSTTGTPPVTTTWQTLDLIMSGAADGPDSDVAAAIKDSPLGTADDGLTNWRLESVEARTISDTNTVRFAQLSVGLGDFVAPYLLGKCVGSETATTPPTIDFSQCGYDYSMNKNADAGLKINTIFTDTAIKYFGKSFIYDANTASWSTPLSEYDGNTHLLPEASIRTVGRLTTPAYTSGEYALQQSNSWKVSQSHGIIAIATGTKALCAVLRNELSQTTTLPIQYFDPSANSIKAIRTLLDSAATSYTEDGIEAKTGWAYWPAFVSTVPTAAESGASFDGAIHVRLGGADSGLLRSDLTYEVGYSLYDITTNTETNVCDPARIRTGSTDYVAFTIFRNIRLTGTNQQACGSSLNVPVQKVPIEKVNYYQYRFYYRALGSQEWLPAGHLFASDLLFNGQNDTLWLAQNPLGLSIGGAPGQFNDYSELPKDSWKDVALFQNRFFWCSDKQAIFSLTNNAFSYPARNCISLPSGEFRGMTVHVFYGQSQQSARIVFWASDAQYEGRFTGQFALYPVTVSPSFTANFPLDGSDFIIQFRSSITAFSSRSAVVAEGALFYWGESGIYADSGVQPPNKISGPIEPWLGSVYDPTQTSNIHCVYNDKTKEIIWFYTPKVQTSFMTEALVFNAEKNAFTRFGFMTEIDWCQAINLSQEGARKRLACGKRLLTGHSFSIYPQRAVFFDEINQTGDLKHGKEFLVKEIQATTSGSRLILASGFDIPSFADISIGESFLISQAFEYTESENDYNGRFTISDIGVYYFDIDEALTAETFSADKLLPIWLDKYSNIPFKMRTRFMMPGTRWDTFMINYLAMSIRLPYSILQDFNVGLFSNLNSTPTVQTVSVQRNATDHCIRQLSFPHDDEKTHGIGYGFELSGNVNGASWRLDWLGINAQQCEDLGRFEQGE